jgi:hypothetical protein
MKSTILLTTALFLASAPSPDSKTISELSAGFLSTGDNHGLMAAEFTADTPTQMAIQNKQTNTRPTQEQLQIN